MFWGCAKISSPTGGPRDKTPPVITVSEPGNGATLFTGKKVVITFDEFIVLEKINDKFLVSPPMVKKPEIFTRGKNLIIEFDEDLRENTTYTFNFQDAIRDLNEGNIFDNYQFVFSTGKVIDSLSVRGNVFTAFNLEIPENTSVLLYSNLADSAVKKSLPDYISRVSPTGSFSINNIRSGQYRLYALKDIDNSNNYNLLQEEIGFMDTTIVVTPEENYFPVVKDTAKVKTEKAAVPDMKDASKEITEVAAVPDSSSVRTANTIILFKAAGTAYFLTASDRKVSYNLVFTLSLPPDTMNFGVSIIGAGPDSYFVERSRKRDTLNVWITDSALYSQQLITAIVNHPFTDTTETVISIDDTIQMRFMTPKAPRGLVKRTPLQVSYNMQGGTLKPGQQMIMTSQTPLRDPDTSLIRIYETLDKKQLKIPYVLIRDTTSSLRYKMNAKLITGKKYLFIADSAAFSNVYGKYSDSTGIRFTVPEASNFGKLTFNITGVKDPLIIQLLNKEEKVLAERSLKADGKIVFPLLDKGFYRLRAIFDMNGDGQWTTGDYSKRRQPEQVSFYTAEINLPIGWEMDIDWAPSIEILKDQKLRQLKKR